MSDGLRPGEVGKTAKLTLPNKEPYSYSAHVETTENTTLYTRANMARAPTMNGVDGEVPLEKKELGKGKFRVPLEKRWVSDQSI